MKGKPREAAEASGYKKSFSRWTWPAFLTLDATRTAAGLLNAVKSLQPERRTSPELGALWAPPPPLAEGDPDHLPLSRAAPSSPEKNLLSQGLGLSCSPLSLLRGWEGKEGAPG